MGAEGIVSGVWSRSSGVRSRSVMDDGALDSSILLLLEMIAFGGAEHRLEVLGLPATLASAQRLSRDALDRHDLVESEEGAASVLRQTLPKIVAGLSTRERNLVLARAMTIGRDLRSHEAALLMWSILVELASDNGSALPGVLGRGRGSGYVSRLRKLEHEMGARVRSRWEAGYTERHGGCDPDLLARQRWSIDALAAMLGEVEQQEDRAELREWAERTARSAGISVDDVGDPWP